MPREPCLSLIVRAGLYNEGSFLHTGGPFHSSIPDIFPLTNNSDGMGGQTKEELALASVGGDERLHDKIGHVYKDDKGGHYACDLL